MTVAATWTPVTLSAARRQRETEPVPWFHLIEGQPRLVWLVEGSQLFEVEPALSARLDAGDQGALAVLRKATTPRPHGEPQILDQPVAVSLALAQACNLSCDYCYADGGRFGGPPRLMSLGVARRAVDQLISGANGRPVTLGFLGGEVLLHRRVLHETVVYAARRAEEAGVRLGFSITTNGVLMTPADVSLFRDHEFAVTVSLDGGEETNDRHRRSGRGEGTFRRVLAAVADLLAEPGGAKVAARATVTRGDLRVQERVAELAEAGFAEVGVSPLRTGPDPSARLRASDWRAFLAEMVRAADSEVARLRRGNAPRFTNLASALREIHRGSARPLPCGSAASYVAVGADGDYWSCHRTVDAAGYRLGDVEEGLSRDARRAFLSGRGVDGQEPCRSCWARYLCGGGCHAEVDEVGREGCDYVRGWLEHCISLYADCSANSPGVLRAMGLAV
nr:hypothetical protein [uncultured bacterium]